MSGTFSLSAETILLVAESQSVATPSLHEAYALGTQVQGAFKAPQPCPPTR